MASLQITKKLSVTPLIDIENPAFANVYSNGLWWALYGDYERESPLPDHYLIDNLIRNADKGTFDGQHDHLLHHVGFYFGMVHGAILVPRTGQLRPDVTALATFSHPESAHGYTVARGSCFYDQEPASRIDTESDLLAVLCFIAQDAQKFPHDAAANWHYGVGCILGSLSVSLFPATRQEWQAWEAEHRALLAKTMRDAAQGRQTEPLPALPALQEA